MEDESGFAPIKRSYVMGVDMTPPYEAMFRENTRTFADKLDGCITVDKYDELAKKAEKRMSEIDEELIALSQDFKGSEMTATHLLKLASNANELFKSSKPAIKNQILRLLVSNLKIEQKRLQFNLLEPFNYIKKLDSRPKWLPALDTLRTASIPYDENMFESVKVLVDNFSASPVLRQL